MNELKRPRRTSDFQGVQRAAKQGGQKAPKVKNKSVSLTKNATAQDISMILRNMRKK